MEYVYYLDSPLFQYRWHQNNQTNLQNRSGILKLWLDEYKNSFECTEEMLNKVNLTKNDVEYIFCEYINKATIRHIINGELNMAKRLRHFALSAYPEI